MHATLHLLEETDFPAIRRRQLEILQVNLGYKCNQQCLHCHVNAGPNRKEVMTKSTIEEVFLFLNSSGVKILDLTGGAPELNPNFCELVVRARDLGIHVIDRCNLTILNVEGQEELAEFLAENRVEIIASLPCYLESNVDQQRGSGVYKDSIKGLIKLNNLGYGKEQTGLKLNLVYNPQGPSLPPAQQALEQDYKTYLQTNHSIVFNNLYTLANMPINRFGSTLVSKGTFNDYMLLLRNSYNASNLQSVMCRNLVSVDWQGYVFDCDFNQMLNLPLGAIQKSKVHLRDLSKLNLEGKPISIKDHCYGCTAGQGSSCGGALI